MNTAVKRYAHVRGLTKAREKQTQMVYKGVRTEQRNKKGKRLKNNSQRSMRFVADVYNHYYGLRLYSP